MLIGVIWEIEWCVSGWFWVSFTAAVALALSQVCCHVCLLRTQVAWLMGYLWLWCLRTWRLGRSMWSDWFLYMWKVNWRIALLYNLRWSLACDIFISSFHTLVPWNPVIIEGGERVSSSSLIVNRDGLLLGLRHQHDLVWIQLLVSLLEFIFVFIDDIWPELQVLLLLNQKLVLNRHPFLLSQKTLLLLFKLLLLPTYLGHIELHLLLFLLQLLTFFQ